MEDFIARSEILSDDSYSEPETGAPNSKFDTRYDTLSMFSNQTFTETFVFNRSDQILTSVIDGSYFSILWMLGIPSLKFSNLESTSLAPKSATYKLFYVVKASVVETSKFLFSKFPVLFSILCFLYLDIRVDFAQIAFFRNSFLGGASADGAEGVNLDGLAFELCFPFKFFIASVFYYWYVTYRFQEENLNNLIFSTERGPLDMTRIPEPACGRDSNKRFSCSSEPVLSLKEVPLNVLSVTVVGMKLTFVPCPHDDTIVKGGEQKKDSSVGSKSTVDPMYKYNAIPIHVRRGVMDHAIPIYNLKISFHDNHHYVSRSYEDCAQLYIHLKNKYDSKNGTHHVKVPKLSSQRKLFKRIKLGHKNSHLDGTLDLVQKDRNVIVHESPNGDVNLDESNLMYWQYQQCEVLSFIRLLLLKDQFSEDPQFREFVGFPKTNSKAHSSVKSRHRVLPKSSSDEPELEVTLSRKNIEFHKEIYNTSAHEPAAVLFKPDFGPPAPEINLMDTFSESSSAMPFNIERPIMSSATVATDGSNVYEDVIWRGNTMDTIEFLDLSAKQKNMYFDPRTEHNFKVRGKHYLSDKGKIDAGLPLGKLVLVEVIEIERDHCNNPTIPIPPGFVQPVEETPRLPDRYDHIASRGKVSRRVHVLQNLVDKPFIHVLNLQIPGDPPVSIVCYFLIPRKYIDDATDVANHNNGAQNNSPRVDTSSEVPLTDEELVAKRLVNKYFTLPKDDVERLAVWGIGNEDEQAGSGDVANAESLEDSANKYELNPYIYSNSDHESDFDSSESDDSETEKSTIGSFRRSPKKPSMISRLLSSRSNSMDEKEQTRQKSKSKQQKANKMNLKKMFFSDNGEKMESTSEAEDSSMFSKLMKWKKGAKKDGSKSEVSMSNRGSEVESDTNSDINSEVSTGVSSSTGSIKGSQSNPAVIDTKQHILNNSNNSSLFNINNSEMGSTGSSPRSNAPVSSQASNVSPSVNSTTQAATETTSPATNSAVAVDPKSKDFVQKGGLVPGDVTFASPWEGGGLPLEDFRNKRFKLIPTIVEGPWVVKAAVGSTPVLLGRRVAQRYFAGPSYMEIDVDVGSSVIASRIVALCRGYATAFTCHLGILMESQEDDELPEKIIAMVGLRKIDVNIRSKLYENSSSK